tara:strand:- start:263 stop:460 length:198 start_codon:yes stop_codon:yes gene_type:complete
MNPIKEEFLKNVNSENMLGIVECITIAENAGLLVEVVHTALSEMRKHPKSSPLLCLQVAIQDWDI